MAGKTIIELPGYQDFVEKDLLVVTSDEASSMKESQAYKTTLEEIGDIVTSLGLGGEPITGEGSCLISGANVTLGDPVDGSSVFIGTKIISSADPTETRILNKLVTIAPDYIYESLEVTPFTAGGFDFDTPYIASTTEAAGAEVLKDRVYYDSFLGAVYDLVGSLSINSDLVAGYIDQSSGTQTSKGSVFIDKGSLFTDGLTLQEASSSIFDSVPVVFEDSASAEARIRTRYIHNDGSGFVISANSGAGRIDFDGGLQCPYALSMIDQTKDRVVRTYGSKDVVFANRLATSGVLGPTTLTSLPHIYNKGPVNVTSDSLLQFDRLEAKTAICGNILGPTVSYPNYALKFTDCSINGERGLALNSEGAPTISYIRVVSSGTGSYSWDKGGKHPLLASEIGTPSSEWSSGSVQLSSSSDPFESLTKDSYYVKVRGPGTYIMSASFKSREGSRLEIGGYEIGASAYTDYFDPTHVHKEVAYAPVKSFKILRAVQVSTYSIELSWSGALNINSEDAVDYYIAPWFNNNTTGRIDITDVKFSLTKT